ncbi:MAG: hypothetical protein ACI84C_002423 [Flavobacteriales bacterium]|jgi:hypothetical protein
MNYSKLALFTLMTALLFNHSAFAQWSVSDPVSVTNEDDSYGYKSPRLGINADGDPMVFWMRTGSEAFFISTLTAGSFSAPAQVPFNGLNPNLWSGSLGPNMAAFGNDVYVTFEVYGQAIYLSHSADGGVTWENPVEAFVPPAGRKATIPIVAVGPNGQPYVAYVNTNNAEQDAYYGFVKSDDFGVTFTAEVDASSSSNEEVCECCNGHIAVAENGDIYVAYRNNEANVRDIWLARSTDGGSTFGSAFDIDQTDWILSGCPSNGPHFAFSNDQLVTSFFSGVGSAGSGVYISSFDSSSDDIGSTLGVQASDETSGGQNRPRIAASGDTLAVVWQETFAGSTEIGMSISTNGSLGFTSDSFRITDSPTTQQQPDIVYSSGSFHVVYEDPDSGTVMYQEISQGGLGIDAITELSFTFGPNPSSDLVRIQSKEYPYNLTVINQVGQVLVSEKVTTASYNFSVVDFPSGLYCIKGESSRASRCSILVVR